METCIIAVDLMGGDYAPDVVIQGIKLALAEDETLRVLAVGPEDHLSGLSGERIEKLPASQIIAMDEHPANAVRSKKDSSIVVGCRAVKAGQADGFFSAGSTGAVLVGATLHMGRVKGVSRPMLGTIVPSATGPLLLCDIGANADCKPEYLLQFGQMGAAYMKSVFDVQAPKVALLNIGEEDTKGSMFAQEVHALMREKLPGFAGNAQGKDIAYGGFDVIVTDGFTGNVVLKTIEGTTTFLFKSIKSSLMSSAKSKIGALLIKSSLRQLKHQFNPDTYGGAPLIGVKGACVIGHGNSNAEAIKNGILMTARVAKSGLNDRIAAVLETAGESAVAE